MRSDGQHLLRSDKHECSNASKLNFLSGAVPDCFLNVGCQNHRLTQELRTLWSDLMFSYKLLKHSHSYAYSVSIQGIIESNSDADIGDVNYVLRHSEDFFPMPPLSLDITSFVLLTCSHLFTYLHLIHQKSNNYEQGSANPRFLPVLGRGEPKQVLPPLRILDSKNLLIKFCVSSEDSDCCEVQKNCLYNTFCEYLTPIPKLDGVYLLSKSRLMDRNNHSFRRRVGRESYSKTTGMVDATEIRNHTVTSNGCTVSVPSKLFSEASGESEAAWDSQTLKSQKVASFDRNHSTSQPPDLLVRKLVEWFYLASKNSSDVCPLFLRIRGILKYKEMSSIVPLSNGIPVFCAARFREILSQLVLKSTSQHDLPSQSESPATNKKSTLTIDLGQLNFYVEVLPIGSPYCGLSIPQNIHDTYVHRKPYNKRNRENHTESFTSRIQNPDVESSEASPGPSVFINIAYSTMEEECVAIDGWLGQHNISKIPSSQQCFLRLFIFQMLWYLHDRSVNCLRSLGPVTEKSLETILQHIEDTCKAMQTPLFNPCNILLNHSYISSSEDELLNRILNSKSYQPCSNNNAPSHRIFVTSENRFLCNEYVWILFCTILM
ncbi:unnamed protein product [Heterobilharzia americana]|nr:unnamed protein product [Heterobilharzia americana]